MFVVLSRPYGKEVRNPKHGIRNKPKIRVFQCSKTNKSLRVSKSFRQIVIPAVRMLPGSQPKARFPSSPDSGGLGEFQANRRPSWICRCASGRCGENGPQPQTCGGLMGESRQRQSRRSAPASPIGQDRIFPGYFA